MVNFLLFCMAVMGLTELILNGDIFAPLRNLLSHIFPKKVYALMECHQCMGTWVGFFVGYFLLTDNFVTVLLCGFAGSFLASVYHILYEIAVNYSLYNTSIELEDSDD